MRPLRTRVAKCGEARRRRENDLVNFCQATHAAKHHLPWLRLTHILEYFGLALHGVADGWSRRITLHVVHAAVDSPRHEAKITWWKRCVNALATGSSGAKGAT